MRKKLIQRTFVYMLLISLLITLGMTIQPLNHKPLANEPLVTAEAISPEQKEDSLPGHAPYASETFQSQSVPSYVSHLINVSEAAEDAPSTAIEELPSAKSVDETPTYTYEVTAFYLNVRTSPNATASIVKVVKQGSVFEVIAVTDNGWLELKDGGYMKGSYARLIESQTTAADAGSQGIVSSAIGEESSEPVQEQSEKEDSEAAPDIDETQINEPTSIVASESGLTEAHIEKIFEGTALAGEGLEQAILEIEKEYGINAYFTIAVMKLESGNGKSKLAQKKNNLFGLNAIDGDKYNKAFSFKTKGDSVRKFGQLLSKNYVGKGLKTVERVAKKYCPANSKWSSMVKNIMKSDYKKL
ncbi:beta-N-acetylglucosaminidase [Paenibacillus castaneae]|uniref:glucosaminidase domain-containing protein n=1 Tax=Paenibacillus castaneae TaxID=474957 RepID=UPI000C9AD0E9|nr:glucosaminidase domain-containing protein [Paenibacillus castaneae]NIK76746.1 beta-N-acetylglucosaminidase [Paenibacillus castaneae]